MKRRTLFQLLGLTLLPGLARADVRGRPNLKQALDSHVVARVEYCESAYRLTFADGTSQIVAEMNLRLKTDSSELGPRKQKPVLLRAGMRGDRFQLIFASPEDIGTAIQRC